MNHWFLCGRDVMWALVGTFPVAFAVFLARLPITDGDEFNCLLLSVLGPALFQWLGILFIYEGWLR
jgi:hypothetical protein